MDKKQIIREVKIWVCLLLVAFFCAALIDCEVMAKVKVEKRSMESTLFEDQQLIVNKLSYKFHDPERGDIIIFLMDTPKGTIINEFTRYIDNIVSKFKDEEPENETLVKRVIGIEGDEIDIRDGFVYLNGSKLDEAYVNGDTFAEEFELPVVVGKNQLFVLGDNRKVSLDSRSFGFINFNQVEGKVIYRVFPFDKFGTIK